MSRDRLRVAIVGGGCAGMAAAFELTNPRLEGRYDVAIYQMGWRLGGKGASGRGPNGRIEEHGLHLWMGYYENAFRMMRDCYAELGRDRESCPIADWTDAFAPENFNVAADWSPSGRWLLWRVHFAAEAGMPGDPDPVRWTVPEYMARAAALVGSLLRAIRERHPDGEDDERGAGWLGTLLQEPTQDRVNEAVSRLLKFGALAGLGAVTQAIELLEPALRAPPEYAQSTLLALVEAIGRAARTELERLVERDDETRRLWEIADIALAVIRGSIRYRLAFDPRGFDAIDAYDSREWLRMNGASERSINSAFIRALYDLAFAYEKGDAKKPSMSAGAALRGALRAFFTYRGAFFWKMQAGMGDVVFGPLYEVLKRRGARFEFFHRLRNVGISELDASGRRHVRELAFDVQARTADGSEYRPLVDVKGLPCWPACPDYDQLDRSGLDLESWDPESQWDEQRVDTKTLVVGRDFDFVVLAVGLGAIPYVCAEMLAADERWREMVERVSSVPTQAFQLWLEPPMSELGWQGLQTNVSGFVEPFDTWADMTHLVPVEDWPRAPGAIAYFCNALPEADGTGAAFVEEQKRVVLLNAKRFLNDDVVHLWPGACSQPGRFRWETLVSPEDAKAGGSPVGEDRLESQFWIANVRPNDRYSQAVPGSAKYRISPLDPSFDNLAAAGDWTNSGLNMGCVEAAVMSGRLAAHAISKFPPLTDIVGFDHP